MDGVRSCRATIVNASVAWQSRRRSNGGLSTCVQPYRDCHVATLLAMTDQGGCAWDVVRSRRPTFVIASAAWQSRRRGNGGAPTCIQLHRAHRDCHVALLLAMTEVKAGTRGTGYIHAHPLCDCGRSVAIGRRSNGGLSTCVRGHRAHRDCRVAALLAMTG